MGTMQKFIYLIICLYGLWLGEGMAAESSQEVEIIDPYLEMHTGPGEGYPIFHVIERGERIKIIKRRTDWFKIQAGRDKQGWVDRAQMEQTLTPGGEKTKFRRLAAGDFSGRRWEAGLLGGDFKGSTVMTAYGDYFLTENFLVELSLSQILGKFSSSTFLNLGLAMQPFPEWRLSPFFTLGTGIIDTRARSTLVQAADRTDSAAYVGVGVRMYFTRRFMLRAELKDYVIFSSDNDNEEIREWKVGFGVFF